MAIVLTNSGVGPADSFGSSSGARTTSFNFNVSGNFLVVGFGGYRASSASTDVLTVTVGGVSMTAWGSTAWGDGNTGSNSSFFQWFVLKNPPTGTQAIVGTYDPSAAASPFLQIGAASYSGVGTVNTVINTTGTESGTSMSFTFGGSTNPNSLYFNHWMHEPLSGQSVTSYNQTALFSLDLGNNAQGIVGQANGTGGSLTFSASRQNGADYSGSGWYVDPLPDPVVVTPLAATLALSGKTPSIVTPQTVTPAAATLTVTGSAPTVTAPATLTPSKASLAITGYPPVVSTPVTVTPAPATFSLTASAPLVTMLNRLVPAAAALTLVGTTPVVSTPVTVAPGAAAMAITGGAPTVMVSQTVFPAGGSFTLTGGTPDVSTTDNKLISPTPATFSLTGQTPNILIPIKLFPTPASLSVTGAAPQVLTPRVVTPSPATLSLTGRTPNLVWTHVFTPTPATLTLNGLTPGAGITVRYLPSPATFVISGGVPTVDDGSPQFDFPPTATVFTLRGLNVGTPLALGVLFPDTMDEVFQGHFDGGGYSLTKLKYPASLSKTSIVEGVKALDAALLSTSGNIIVIGHSMGSQVISRWIRTYISDPTRLALAGRVWFVTAGNPLHSLNGKAWRESLPEVDGIIGQPILVNTPWKIVEVARRWDGWTDWPNDDTNEKAVKNAKSGETSLHTNYEDVDLFDSAHTRWRNGNTMYVLTREFKMPMYRKTLFLDPKYETVVRKWVEDAYVRPANDPGPNVIPVTNLFWQKVLEGNGIPNG